MRGPVTPRRTAGGHRRRREACGRDAEGHRATRPRAPRGAGEKGRSRDAPPPARRGTLRSAPCLAMASPSRRPSTPAGSLPSISTRCAFAWGRRRRCARPTDDPRSIGLMCSRGPPRTRACRALRRLAVARQGGAAVGACARRDELRRARTQGAPRRDGRSRLGIATPGWQWDGHRIMQWHVGDGWRPLRGPGAWRVHRAGRAGALAGSGVARCAR